MQKKRVMQGMPVCGIQLGWRIGIADMNTLDGIFLHYGRYPDLVFRGAEMAELGCVGRRLEAAGAGVDARMEVETVVA